VVYACKQDKQHHPNYCEYVCNLLNGERKIVCWMYLRLKSINNSGCQYRRKKFLLYNKLQDCHRQNCCQNVWAILKCIRQKNQKKFKITMQQGFQIVSTYVFVGQNNEKVETENKVIMLWNVIQYMIQFTCICFCKIAFNHLYMQLNYKIPVIRFPILPFHILLSQFEKV
jgi:hypothetical protein